MLCGQCVLLHSRQRTGSCWSKPGESLIVVNNAQNHTIGSELVGRHESRFRVCTYVSSNENYLDIDNPDVPQPRQMVRFDIDGSSAPQPRLQRAWLSPCRPSA
ncbi:MAG: hypothetical protein ACLUQ6_00090 [Alistipes onderdonkii]